ncbi:hypothetical protein SLE2022_335420 [Rubroshorea leprosula]
MEQQQEQSSIGRADLHLLSTTTASSLFHPFRGSSSLPSSTEQKQHSFTEQSSNRNISAFALKFKPPPSTANSFSFTEQSSSTKQSSNIEQSSIIDLLLPPSGQKQPLFQPSNRVAIE